jgi:hypothetical protein
MDNRTALFHMAYEGPALATHEMNVKDFAPTLLAIGELLEDSNYILNGEQIKIVVNIRATHPGSIDVILSVVQTFIHQTVSFFNRPDINAIINAKELLGLIGIAGGSGVIELIRWIRGRKIKSIVKVDAGSFKMELEDGEARVISSQEVKLFGFLKIRKNIEAVVRTPLTKEGVEKVVFVSDGSKSEINREEAEYFAAPPVEEEKIGETETETHLQIANISFQEGGKWKFSDGNVTFFADILDIDFLEKVKKNEAVFAKDDIFKVKLRCRQFLTDGGIKAEYAVLKVIEHRSAAVQIKLPFQG